ncbi:P-loop containing nucleoside triphosphate hydrolase protein [Mycena amicta]|nr:P-loop containing nucleoside triphosphate hydrolase protein [Mycena amicta]
MTLYPAHSPSFGLVDSSQSTERTAEERLSSFALTPLELRVASPILQGHSLLVRAISAFDTKFHRAAFISILSQLDPSVDAVQALIIAPRREHALRIYKELRQEDFPGVRCHCCIGGLSARITYDLLKEGHGIHVIVGTPGRVNDLVHRGILKVDRLKTVLVDELDDIVGYMNMQDILVDLFAALPTENLQKIIFTITMLPESKEFCAKTLQEEHARLEVNWDDLKADV